MLTNKSIAIPEEDAMEADAKETRELHVVVGAGPIGTAVAELLVAEGQRVVVVTRSGGGPAGAERVAANAGDVASMRRHAMGATAIYNCANPKYHRWPTDWPPIARALLEAAESSGAVLVTVSNLYGYGPASKSIGVEAYDESHPMTESTPLASTGKKGPVRAQMWRDALAACQVGRVKAVEIRASDYIGPGASSVIGDRLVPRLLRGKGAPMLGSTQRPHTWTYTDDVARFAVLVARDPKAWGHVWHVPSNPARTQQQVVDDIAGAAGVPTVHVRALPHWVLRALGPFAPVMRELAETEYQFGDDFVMDSSLARTTFGFEPTPWSVVLDTTVRSYQ